MAGSFIVIAPKAASLAFKLGIPVTNARNWQSDPAAITGLLGRVSKIARDDFLPEGTEQDSVLDCLNTKSPKSLKVVLHGFGLFGGVERISRR